ncbi:MAG: flagellar FliJ family protein [Pseudomonadota bacterium]|nr:flagellar FliJ family protein [Pseudomonadota bacterium]MEC8676677.1 flagellar FliJ family protein [Pseudomonadota bacterium]
MSKLDSLIRLHERTLDEARRELGRAEAAVASAAAAIDALEAEIKAEQAAAGADLTGQFGYANYARQAIARRAELHTAHQQAEVAREQVREKVAVAFAELKKFEITAERRAALAQQEENRRLQGELDEIAQQQDRQKQARGA